MVPRSVLRLYTGRGKKEGGKSIMPVQQKARGVRVWPVCQPLVLAKGREHLRGRERAPTHWVEGGGGGTSSAVHWRINCAVNAYKNLAHKVKEVSAYPGGFWGQKTKTDSPSSVKGGEKEPQGAHLCCELVCLKPIVPASTGKNVDRCQKSAAPIGITKVGSLSPLDPPIRNCRARGQDQNPDVECAGLRKKGSHLLNNALRNTKTAIGNCRIKVGSRNREKKKGKHGQSRCKLSPLTSGFTKREGGVGLRDMGKKPNWNPNPVLKQKGGLEPRSQRTPFNDYPSRS